MSPHATAELLSAYLDHALAADETRRIKEHLADCDACRARFDGLRRVVTRLGHLERMAPPPTLDQLVARRVALEGGKTGFLDRLELHLGGFERQSSLLGLFGLVVAFAVMILLFAQALDERRKATIPVIFQDPVIHVPQEYELAGRVLHREGDVWIEEGVDRGASAETVGIGSETFRTMLDRHPELAELEAVGFKAVIRLDGRVLRFEIPPRLQD